MPARSIPPRALALLAVITVVWGTTWPLFAVVMREVSVWTFRSVSMSAAGLLLLGVARALGQPMRIPRRYWRPLAVATVCYLVTWNIAGTYAAVLLPSGQAAVLGFTMPLWAALVSWAVLGERFGGRLVLALAFGAAAVALLMVPSFAAYANAPLGMVLGLLAGLGWAVGTLVLKRAAVPVPATVLTGWQLLAASVPITIAALALGDHRWFVPSWPVIASIAFVTVLPMGIGNIAWFSIVGLLPANVAGLSSILVPVIAMISGALVHDEPLGPMQWAAIACCAASLALVLLRPAPQSTSSDARAAAAQPAPGGASSGSVERSTHSKRLGPER
jgi:drug/metabolite transporter (DMT)-like permease